MDYEAVRAGYDALIPLNQHLGVKILEVTANSGKAVLPERDELKNHVGSQHAGALFSVGEAASGAAFIGAFASRLGEITPLAETAEIAYKKIAKGEITATGTFTQDPDALFAELDADGRVRFPIEVELTNSAGDTVATMNVAWYVRKNEQ